MEALVRCKFVCLETTSRHSMLAIAPDKRTYGAKFLPVTSGSEENKAFYAEIPSGALEFQSVKRMPFESGKEYYLDIIPAE